MFWRYSVVVTRACWNVRRTPVSSFGLTTVTRSFDSLKNATKSVLQFNSDPFNAEDVAKCHSWDKLNDKEWVLVYRDGTYSKTQPVASILLPITICAGLVLVGDSLFNDEHFQLTQKLINDASELGILIIIPCFLIIAVFFILLRVQSMRLLRIYQSRRNHFNFVAIAPRWIVLKQKLPFSRGEVCSISSVVDSYETASEFFRNTLLGTLSIKGKPYTHSDDSFISNNVRSFMLGDSNLEASGDAVKRRYRQMHK